MSTSGPSLEELRAAADSLGLSLSSGEAEIYRSRIAGQLAALARFYEAWVADTSYSGDSLRDAGHEPTVAEDPYRAWLWHCHIKESSGGLLDGKTVGLKDNIPVAGLPLTYGSALMKDYVADFDAPVTTRLLAAGATIVGKNNMDNFSMPGPSRAGLGDCDRPLNPHGPQHTTGGSSSGGGAALAAGECDIALGGDQGGSIRIPAAWCGVVGLKATFGMIPHTGIIGSDPTVDHVGPMARNVADAAAAFQVLAGSDGVDPRQRDIPHSVDIMTALEGDVEGLKIGILEEAFGHGADPAVDEAILTAVDVLASCGAKVARISVAEHLAADPMALAIGTEGGRLLFESTFVGGFDKTMYPVNIAAALGRAVNDSRDSLPPGMKLRYLAAEFTRREWHGSLYAVAMNARIELTAKYDAALRDVDLLVMPTVPVTAPVVIEHGAYLEALEATILGGAQAPSRAMVTRNTIPFNMSGHPALTIPVARLAGLPVGMQMVGRYRDEAILFRVAAAYQANVDWAALTAVPGRL